MMCKLALLLVHIHMGRTKAKLTHFFVLIFIIARVRNLKIEVQMSFHFLEILCVDVRKFL